MDFLFRDSLGFSNPQTSIWQGLPLKEGNRMQNIWSFGSRMIKDTISNYSRIKSAPATVGRVDGNYEEKKNIQNYKLKRQSSCGDLLSKNSSEEIPDDSVKTSKGAWMLFPSKYFRARSGNYSFEAGEKKEKCKQSMVNDSNLSVLKECRIKSVETTQGQNFNSSRINSAPPIVGRVDGNYEEKRHYELKRQTSCGDLLSKHSSQEIREDSMKTRKGGLLKRILSKTLRATRTGVYSLDVYENFEKRKPSLVKDSKIKVSEKDCSMESFKTQQVSGMFTIGDSPARVYSVEENEKSKKRKRPWFKGFKSRASIGECPGGSDEVERKRGVPKLEYFAVDLNEETKSCTKSKIRPAEEMNPSVSKRENPEKLVDPKQDQQILGFAEELKAQTKFHSMAENRETCLAEILNPDFSFEKSLIEEGGGLLKHQKSKRIEIMENDSEAKSKSSVQYLYYNAKHFQHFHYIYNLMRDCYDRKEGMRKTSDEKNALAEDIIVKIGIVGEFTEDNLNLLSKRRGKREIRTQNQQIWKQSPLLCFQESKQLALKMLRREKACHKIVILSDPNHKETEKVEDSIYIVCEDKEQILKMISVCLEEQIHQMLQDWLLNLPTEGLGKLLPGIVAEIEDIKKQMLFNENNHHATGASAFQSVVKGSIVPKIVKEYLFGRSDVSSFGIWRNSAFKVFVNKTTEIKELENELKKLHQIFFETYNLKIVKGRLEVIKSLMQGDPIQRNEDENNYVGTLGGFVTKTNDDRKIYALTCNHIFPIQNLPAYTDNPSDEKIGTCVFTTSDSCDFAAIEIMESFSNKCDLPLRREDKKKTSARVYDESLEPISFVYKKGVTTKFTKGSIMSPEYYENCMSKNTFLVEGIGNIFSKEGDSGSLVFCRPKTARQNYINVVGMVYGSGLTLLDDDQNTENLSICYRLHTALEHFKQEQDTEVKFEDDLSTPSASSDDSYEETS